MNSSKTCKDKTSTDSKKKSPANTPILVKLELSCLDGITAACCGDDTIWGGLDNDDTIRGARH